MDSHGDVVGGATCAMLQLTIAAFILLLKQVVCRLAHADTNTHAALMPPGISTRQGLCWSRCAGSMPCVLFYSSASHQPRPESR